MGRSEQGFESVEEARINEPEVKIREDSHLTGDVTENIIFVLMERAFWLVER
ncbi:MAG: hypothetical protein HY730_01865 [Candidatus Tectomicrobia bacterium]|uniref:Uncharacterized protein n=1 Tax=Tectimicrobiota bacterium TaxID=2528274 RepID=A0A933GKI2_UNCTE|nr:hypothetical protein [Candidatus Tectomicrobia bacterium]